MSNSTKSLSIHYKVGDAIHRLLGTRPHQADINRSGEISVNSRGVTTPYSSSASQVDIEESVAVERIFRRYEGVLAASMPKLDAGTWQAFADAFCSCTEIADRTGPELAGALLDHRYGEWDWEQAHTDEDAAALANLTPAEVLALIEVNERFWGQSRDTPFAEKRSLRATIAMITGWNEDEVFADD